MADTIGNLAVVITASDKATPTLKALSGTLAQVAKPTRTLSETFAKLGDAAPMMRLSGAVSLAHGNVTALGRAFASASVPLATGGFVAGVIGATTNFVSTGRQLAGGARALQMSVPALHSFQTAARLAGVAGEDATDGLRSFGQTIYDAVGGRNAEALAASTMPRLGFSLLDAAGKARTGSDALGDMADSLAKLNNDPRSQMMLARTFGVEALLPMLRNGRAGLTGLIADGQRLSPMTAEQADQAKRLGQQWDRMRVTADSLTLSVGGAMAPALSMAMGKVDAWTRANEGWLTSTITQRVGEVAAGTGTFVTMVDKAVTSTIGWEAATTSLQVLMAGRFLTALTGINLAAAAFKPSAWMLRLMGVGAGMGAGTALAGGAAAGGMNMPILDDLGRPMGNWGGADGERRWSVMNSTGSGAGGMTPGEANRGGRPQLGASAPSLGTAEQQARAKQAQDYFVSKGWTPEQSAGLVANIHKESGFNPGAVGDNKAAYGIAQWHGDRRAALAGLTGRSMVGSTFEQQLEAVHLELTQGQERKAGDALRQARTANEAGGIVSRQYERPFARDAEAASRGATAEGFLRRFNMVPSVPNGIPPTGPVFGPPAAVRSPMDGPPAPPQQTGSVDVNVRFANAPRGLIASVRPEGNARADAPLVETAMQPAGAR